MFEYLYVSLRMRTGTECSFASMATNAVPAREYTDPLELTACAPRKTMDTSEMTDPIPLMRRYVQGIPTFKS